MNISLYDFNFPLFLLDGSVFIGFPLSCEFRLLADTTTSFMTRGIGMSSFVTLLSSAKTNSF